MPDYSNRDAQYVDLAAPGGRDLLDDPAQPGRRARAAAAPAMPYSNCGPSEFRDGIGTSFAAPQVAAAAALLLGVDPTLSPDQVEWLLERTATDASPATGCPPCPSAATRSPAGARSTSPPRSTGSRTARRCRRRRATSRTTTPARSAHRARPGRARSPRRSTTGTTRSTSTRSRSTQGQTLFARLGARRAPARERRSCSGSPGTTHVTGSRDGPRADRAARSTAVGGQQRLAYRRARRRASTTSRSKLGAPDAAPRRVHALARRVAEPAQPRRAARPSARRGARAPGCRRRASAAATSFVTTAPAPTNASSPISTPGRGSRRRRRARRGGSSGPRSARGAARCGP